MTRTDPPADAGRLRVVIAGGGVAALETLLALRERAGDLTTVELVAPEPDFWYRPLSVAEAFGSRDRVRLELAGIAGATGATFTLDEVVSVDTDAQRVRTRHGLEIDYDALALAPGAVPRPWLEGVTTFRGPADAAAVEALVERAAAGALRALAFAAPPGCSWPLPVYDLALLASHRLAQAAPPVDLAVVTAEAAPLALFGEAAAAAVRALLEERRVAVHAGRRAAAFDGRTLSLEPDGAVRADAVVALPQLEGPRLAGIPHDAGGFVPTDAFGRVDGVASVFAAGDATAFAVKQGGVATQQADAVAETIAALAGAAIEPQPFRPVLRGLLLTGDGCLFLQRDASGASTASREPLWWPAHKISGRYLAPFLARRGLSKKSPRSASWTGP